MNIKYFLFISTIKHFQAYLFSCSVNFLFWNSSYITSRKGFSGICMLKLGSTFASVFIFLHQAGITICVYFFTLCFCFGMTHVPFQANGLQEEYFCWSFKIRDLISLVYLYFFIKLQRPYASLFFRLMFLFKNASCIPSSKWCKGRYCFLNFQRVHISTVYLDFSIKLEW